MDCSRAHVVCLLHSFLSSFPVISAVLHLFVKSGIMTDATRIFVARLSKYTTDVDLQAQFQNYGTVVEAKVIVDHATGRSKRYGFVTFSSPEEAEIAINNNGNIKIEGSTVHVEQAASCKWTQIRDLRDPELKGG